jgi:hypothetical protein
LYREVSFCNMLSMIQIFKGFSTENWEILGTQVVSRGGFHVGNGINWKGQVFSKMRNHTLTNRMTVSYEPLILLIFVCGFWDVLWWLRALQLVTILESWTWIAYTDYANFLTAKECRITFFSCWNLEPLGCIKYDPSQIYGAFCCYLQ